MRFNALWEITTARATSKVSKISRLNLSPRGRCDRWTTGSGCETGDPIIRRYNIGDGIQREEFQGIVVSSDGDGNGVVFAPPTEPNTGEVRVSVRVQPNFPLEYIELHLEHGAK
jgi:hypothetical protein